MTERRYMHHNFPYQPLPQVKRVHLFAWSIVTGPKFLHEILQNIYAKSRAAYRLEHEEKDYRVKDVV